ncbi:tetrapyrrole methylase family protein / MazG family protein [Anaerocolumna jejuensis DSM 15929]|uniref:Tetrapyrrole methylase family protein / MazG family protein n=1 Tax=Anaerocolumna jejuensis DSM 15929 TaxID=1121322 RepID=A0A1M6S9V2_9FIRM|nr:nucleoside triphosphate pyrophosphohydrolase [Anaerocolumna jejuensis]SHK41440.1 tetrapyrrole methylase family protein / MazG family protein [Anaerocolumna jejuensis DSM 15929]
MDKRYTFDEFMDIIRYLRSEKGCPWDRKQTHESLDKYMLEEAYESVEAIRRGNTENLCEELGDVLLQIALHAAIAEETREFTIEDIITGESEKMIRRHPHVFGEKETIDAGQVVKNWDEIKKQEKKQKTTADTLQDIPRALPALMRAEKAIKRAAKNGQKGDVTEEVERTFESLSDSLFTLKEQWKMEDEEQLEEKFENLLFQIVNLSVFLQLNAENSLTNATNKFINRFVDIEGLTEKKPQV